MRLNLPTNARWLDEFSSCVQCRKASAGKLMSDRNDVLGSYCRKCAEAAIKNYRVPNPRVTAPQALGEGE